MKYLKKYFHLHLNTKHEKNVKNFRIDFKNLRGFLIEE